MYIQTIFPNYVT